MTLVYDEMTGFVNMCRAFIVDVVYLAWYARTRVFARLLRAYVYDESSGRRTKDAENGRVKEC